MRLDSAPRMNQKCKLHPFTWVFTVLAPVSGVVAYTLCLAGSTRAVVCLLAGIVSGGSLILAGLVARQYR